MIETLQQWNTRLGYCGCCPMPVCPAPVVVNEFKMATACGFRFPFYHPSISAADKQRFFREINEADRLDVDMVRTSTRNFLPSEVERVGTDYREQIKKRVKVSGSCVETTFSRSRLADLMETETQGAWFHTTHYVGEYYWELGVLITQNGGTTSTGTDLPDPVFDPAPLNWISYNFSAVINNSWIYEPLAVRFTDVIEDIVGDISGGSYRYRAIEFLDEILPAEIDAEVAAAPWVISGSVVKAQRFNGATPSTNIYRKIRFRFRIPTSHGGSKFYITYDIAEFPEDGDPSFVSQDNVVEWTGPGTGSSSDPSWLTPWVEIDPPTDPGERRIVNIRYTCYSGTRYGSKPQVMGEALEIPPP